jgi:hypothetical protein
MMKSLTLGDGIHHDPHHCRCRCTDAPPPLEPCATRAVLGRIRLPRAVLANGEPLAAGMYQVGLTSERPTLAVGLLKVWIRGIEDERLQARTNYGRAVRSTARTTVRPDGWRQPQLPLRPDSSARRSARS